TEFRSAALSDAEIRRGDVRRLVADVLGIDVGDVADELGFGMIGAWDSLRQVQMVLALEEYLGRSIDAHEEASIRSVRGIVEFVDGRSNSAARPTAEPSLRGVSVGTTSIFSVDVQQRQMAYCGYDMRDWSSSLRSSRWHTCFCIANWFRRTASCLQ
ncbi:MAG: acyl carrier protein, partial [Gammaproteobacteria bacterium]|nr:acyl carrier protein [Gammaproteobacteria bacterium]